MSILYYLNKYIWLYYKICKIILCLFFFKKVNIVIKKTYKKIISPSSLSFIYYMLYLFTYLYTLYELYILKININK